MKFRNVFLYALVITSSVFSEDIAEPSFKKQKVPIVPHVWLSEELLVLKAQESGLASANHAQNITTTTNFPHSSLIQPDFNWNCGLKIDIGYQPEKLFYFANWSYIRNTAHTTKSTNGSQGFFPVLSLSKTLLSSDFVTSSDFHWELQTNVANAGVIFSWQPVQYFILKNQIALTVASLNQTFKVDYGGGIFNEGIDLLHMYNHFLGIGPTLGVSPNIILGQGFSLIGHFSVSSLVGRFHMKQKEEYLKHFLFHHSHHMIRLRWVLHAKAALSWQKELLYKALVFDVQAGWEWQEYYHQNQLSQNSFDFFGNHPNLILRGGFLSLCLAF